MTEEPPDLNPGHKVGELAAAAQAAAQVGSMRRDAAARQQAEQERAAADVAQEQRRTRAEWERLVADRERVQRRVDEARYDHGDAAGAQALRQQRYDTLVLAREDAAAAGPDKVSPAEQARLERDLHTADEGLDAARARTERAARALDNTTADYAKAAAALDTFEQAHGIAGAAISNGAAVGAEDAAVHLAAQDGVAAQHELTTSDQAATPLVDEHHVAQPEAHDHAGYQTVELADAQAAHAVGLASRLTTAAPAATGTTAQPTSAPAATPARTPGRRAGR